MQTPDTPAGYLTKRVIAKLSESNLNLSIQDYDKIGGIVLAYLNDELPDRLAAKIREGVGVVDRQKS